jgi:hypothetical protein
MAPAATAARRAQLALLVAALAALWDASIATAGPKVACEVRGYAYAGAQDARVGHGIEATVLALTPPSVGDGDIAAWVGVGGPGQGSGGRDAWIQIGLNAFPGGLSHLYYEVDQPGTGVRYHELAATVAIGRRYHLAVLETAQRPGWWRVWLDGAPVSPAFYLAGSERWRPIFTAERWSAAARTCNRFAYRFEHVRVARAAGGSWTPFVFGSRFHDPGYRLIRAPLNAFVVATGGPGATV